MRALGASWYRRTLVALLRQQARPRGRARCAIVPGAYWRAVPPPPATIWARVGGAAALAKKIVPTVLDAKLRLPEVPKFTGVAVT